MTNEFNVLWIDDNPDRRENNRGGVGDHDRINVEPLSPSDAASMFLSENEDEDSDTRDPDLALVDWYLHTDDYTGAGPSIEGILRDRFPSIPVYAFSGKYGTDDFDRAQKRGKHRFALITAPHRLDDEDLIKDLEGYEQIRDEKGEGIEGIMRLLDAPDDIKEKVQSTLPQEFATGLPDDEDPSSALRFARWLRQEFLEKPGLLWDRIWTATKIGVDEEKFDKYSSDITDAEYTGVFSHRNEVWWRTSVRDEVYEKADEQDQTVDRLWKTAPDLFGVEAEDKSACDIDSCEKTHPPQTVAASSPSEEPSFQVHYSCSDIDQSLASSYEDLRVLVEL